MDKKQLRPLARLHGYWLSRRVLPAMAAWPVDQRRSWLTQRLKETLVRAAEGIPFYRERFRKAGFEPACHFQSPADLARVPLLTKDDVRSHYPEMLDPRYACCSVSAHTSGTTGQPMTMRLNEYYVAFDYACMFRHWARAGYRFRDRYAAVRSYVPDTPAAPLWKYNRWQNTLYMSAYHLKPSNAERYLEALLQFRPAYLRGYASSLHVLAEFAYPRRAEFGFVRGLFSASETLSPQERSVIEGTFGKKLWDWYGMTEPAVVITERDDHEGMEVNWEYGYAEFLEAPGLASDERRLIATSLHNPVMPFIRYDTQDIARLDSRMDQAGLYPRVAGLNGRKDDCLLTPDGARLPSLNFYSLLQIYTDIVRFQFVQTDPSHVTMKISTRPSARELSKLVATVGGEVRKRLGPALELSVEVTDRFYTSPDGKTPTFKRLVQPSQPAPAATS
jgi:phenylacetate-CoA ligase